MSNQHNLALYLIFHLSTRCNLECSYCNVHAGPGGRRPVLDLQVFERWLEAFAALEPAEMGIQLHGGEPLVIEPSVELYAAVARNTLARFPRTRLSLVGIQTNGLKLDEARIEALESAGVSVNISIDGPAAIHDRQRRTATGGGSHRGAVRAWQRLRQHGRGAGVISVVTDPQDVVPALDYFIDGGFGEARMNPMRPEGRAAQARDWSEAGFMRDMAAQYEHAARRIAEHNRSHPEAPFYEDNLSTLMRALIGDTAGGGSFNWNFLVDDRGDLWAHPAAYGVESLRLSRDAKPSAALLRQALGLEAAEARKGAALIPGLRALREKLFSPCAACRTPEFCVAYHGREKGDGGTNPVCDWRTELSGRMEHWLREDPAAARRIVPAEQAA